MTALPAKRMDHEIEERHQFDTLIDAVTYYQELAFEYPTVMVYRRMLEAARENLKKAEKRLGVAQEAGEDTTALVAEIDTLKAAVAKAEAALPPAPVTTP